MKEKDLDKLFQEAAKKAKVGNQDEGWTAMKAKLKGAGMVKETKPKFWFNLNSLLITLLFLITGSVGTMWYWSGSQKDSGLEVTDHANNASENEIKVESAKNSNDYQKIQKADNREVLNEVFSTKAGVGQSDASELGTRGPGSETGGLNPEDSPLKASDIENARNLGYLDTSDASTGVLRYNDGTQTNGDKLESEERLSRSGLSNEVSGEVNTASTDDNGLGETDTGLSAGDDTSTNRSSRVDLAASSMTENNDAGAKNKIKNEPENVVPVIAISKEDTRENNHVKIPESFKSDSVFFAAPVLLLPISEPLNPELSWSAPEIKPFENNEDITEPRVDEDTTFKRSRWSIGLEFSPDLSTVGLRGAEDPGYTIGLHGEYHFSSKWSLSGGLGYSKKIYFADQGIGSYPGTNPNWTLNRVDANCDVIDIPINVSYYLNGYEESGFVFGAGLSTYFMLTENYDII
ncbi:MAG: hypothetical protein AAF693_18635, partial [Bacteroidota bacterium]